MKRPGRYARRLLVVMAIVGVIVALGYLWRVSPFASLVTDGGHGPRGGDHLPRTSPGRGPAPGPGGFGGGDRGGRGSSAFSLGNLDDLVGTIVIGVGMLAAVVTVDKLRRKRHPIRPAA